MSDSDFRSLIAEVLAILDEANGFPDWVLPADDLRQIAESRVLRMKRSHVWADPSGPTVAFRYVIDIAPRRSEAQAAADIEDRSLVAMVARGDFG